MLTFLFGILLAPFALDKSSEADMMTTKEAASVDLVPQFAEKLTLRELMNLPPSQKNMIRKISILPARLGRAGFGRFLVVYNTPVYRTMSLVRRHRRRHHVTS